MVRAENVPREFFPWNFRTFDAVEDTPTPIRFHDSETQQVTKISDIRLPSDYRYYIFGYLPPTILLEIVSH